MKALRQCSCAAMTLLLSCSLSARAMAQETATILTGAELSRVVPAGFYFQGLSAGTQLRNSAAARFGTNRYVIVGIVDTAGYAAELRAKYEGFFIADTPIIVGGTELSPGAYGFGFSDAGKFTLLDLTGKEVMSVASNKDAELKRPRPLMMMKVSDRLRLYSGRDYVEISAK